MKPTTDYDDKMRIHAATVAYRQRRLSRRDLLKYLGAASVALRSARSFAPRAMASPAAVSLLQDSPVPADVTRFLTDVGGQFKGTTIKVVTEDTPPGTAITVSFRNSGGSARVHVADEGPGIAPEQQAKIFEPYETSAPAGEGIGLGLAIARRLARSMGGDIELESAPGQGSRFTLVLPAV